MQGLLETIQKNIEFVGISILLMVIVFAVARGSEILIEKKTGVRFTSEKTKVNFVTNDRILSIQTMQLAKKNNANNNLKVFNGDEFTILFKNNIPTRNILIFSDFFRNTY